MLRAEENRDTQSAVDAANRQRAESHAHFMMATRRDGDPMRDSALNARLCSQPARHTQTANTHLRRRHWTNWSFASAREREVPLLRVPSRVSDLWVDVVVDRARRYSGESPVSSGSGSSEGGCLGSHAQERRGGRRTVCSDMSVYAMQSRRCCPSLVQEQDKMVPVACLSPPLPLFSISQPFG